MEGLTVYNMPNSPPNWDRVSIFYIALLAGTVFLWWNRHIPMIRVRGLPLWFSAIALLHIYWILGQITYPIRATMPTVLAYDVQYFGMGIYFPLGIALLQPSNLRFLHVARMQRHVSHPDFKSAMRCNDGNRSWLCRIRNMGYMTGVEVPG